LNKIEFWNVEGHELDSNIDFNDKPNAYGKYQGTSSNHDKVIAGYCEGNSNWNWSECRRH